MRDKFSVVIATSLRLMLLRCGNIRIALILLDVLAGGIDRYI